MTRSPGSDRACPARAVGSLGRSGLKNVLLAIAPPAPSHASSAPASPPRQVQLSRETTLTRWANAGSRHRFLASVLACAAGQTAVPHRRRLSGCLHRAGDNAGPPWHDVGPWCASRSGRTTSRVGGPRSARRLPCVHAKLVMKRRTLRVRLYDHGHQVVEARVGVGEPSTPAPASNSWVRVKFQVGATRSTACARWERPRTRAG
jgi:hypothetical protein